VRELAIHRRLSRVNYSQRCVETSAVGAYQKRGLSLSSEMEIGYVVKDASRWEVDTERDASEFDSSMESCSTRYVIRMPLRSAAQEPPSKSKNRTLSPNIIVGDNVRFSFCRSMMHPSKLIAFLFSILTILNTIKMIE
jgi:hypothetical protein